MKLKGALDHILCKTSWFYECSKCGIKIDLSTGYYYQWISIKGDIGWSYKPVPSCAQERMRKALE